MRKTESAQREERDVWKRRTAALEATRSPHDVVS